MKLIEVPDDVISTALQPLGINWLPIHRKLLAAAMPGLANADVGKLAEGFTKIMHDPVAGPAVRNVLSPEAKPVAMYLCPHCGWMHAPEIDQGG